MHGKPMKKHRGYQPQQASGKKHHQPAQRGKGRNK